MILQKNSYKQKNKGEQTMNGKVKWYNTRNGYGFIQGQDGEDAFVHKSEVPFWTIFLREGDNVEYKKKYTKQGLEAIKLKVI